MNLVSLAELEIRLADYLQQAGASASMAKSCARVLVRAEAQGLHRHGLARAPQYAAHIRHGRVNPVAEPAVVLARGATVLVDAGEGLAHPACELAIREAMPLCHQYGIALAGVRRSHDPGPAVMHLETAAQAGLLGLAFCQTPAVMPFIGGERPLLGTNPVAAAIPRRAAAPVLIDLSMGPEYKPTDLESAVFVHKSSPSETAMAGEQSRMALLALLVELLCVSIAGAAPGRETDSLFGDTGNTPHLAQIFVLIDAASFSSEKVYYRRLENLLGGILQDKNLRLPGARRHASLQRARAEGLPAPDWLPASGTPAG